MIANRPRLLSDLPSTSMVLRPSSLNHPPHLPPLKRRGGPLRSSKHYSPVGQLEPVPGGNDRKRRCYSQTSGGYWKPTKPRRTQLYTGMQNIPAELLLMISTHMSHHDLRALAITSQSFCRLLLPEYLRRRRLVLKGACVRGTSVELRDLSGYASLGLWSVAPTFHPPGEMYCSIPYDTQEARKAMGFLIRFLLEPSNTSNLRSFHFSLRSSNPLLLTSRLAQIQRLFCILPLTQLLISGYGSADYLPSSIILRSGASPGSRTLTSFIIFSDHAFDPGFARATMGILRHSPIRSLTICMVSLSASQWSTLLGELEMALLEDIEIEGDIPRPALIRFLVKHKGLRNIHIQGNVPSDRAQPSRSRGQHFLPNLLTLRAPLAICCDVIERTSDASSLYKLEVETSQLHPHDPLFLRLAEVLWSFQKLDHFGLRLEPSSPPVMPQDLGGCDWDEHPVCKLRKVRTLSFSQNKGRLSPRDIDTMCTYVRSLPMLEIVHAVEDGDSVRAELLDSLRKVRPTLHAVTVISGPLCLKWRMGEVGATGVTGDFSGRPRVDTSG